jgi:hypothetical protein
MPVDFPQPMTLLALMEDGGPVSPCCGAPLIERKGKLVCSRCGRICEGCCEGGRGRLEPGAGGVERS